MAKDRYALTVGLEIHAELRTQTKMFCNSKNDPDETRPNINVCPVCMGHPGTLPVINAGAVTHVLKVGRALGGMSADVTKFDRKNYFYPDIPKGYQISQYQYPLVSGGSLNGVAITRVHLEEDTGTLIHADSGTLMNAASERYPSSIRDHLRSHPRSSASFVDFNRAGVPLLELVTEPVVHSTKEAGDFARELQLLLRYLGVSEANMEKGEMRVEANISVAKKVGLGLDHSSGMVGRTGLASKPVLGTKVEVKNLNSFRAVERAIEYEYARQVSLLEAGEKVIQETRGWDENTGETFSQRRKEESHDYRYFPDPDLPQLTIRDIPEFAREPLQNEMPELPAARRARYERLGLKADDAATLTVNRALGGLFDQVSETLQEKEVRALAASYVTSDLIGLIKKAGKDADTASFPFAPSAFVELIRMVAEKKLSSRGAKDILAVLFERGGTPEKVASEHGLLQKSDAGELEEVIKEVIAANQKVADDYRSGKAAALQFLVGQAMKATRGAGNPEVLRELFISRLK